MQWGENSSYPHENVYKVRFPVRTQIFSFVRRKMIFMRFDTKLKIYHFPAFIPINFTYLLGHASGAARIYLSWDENQDKEITKDEVVELFRCHSVLKRYINYIMCLAVYLINSG